MISSLEQDLLILRQKKQHHKQHLLRKIMLGRSESTRTVLKVDPTRDNYKGPTRWLADSAFTTYFGKPAFHAYGKGNVHPAVGGNVYGHYMLSHNVNPESGKNLP